MMLSNTLKVLIFAIACMCISGDECNPYDLSETIQEDFAAFVQLHSFQDTERTSDSFYRGTTTLALVTDQTVQLALNLVASAQRIDPELTNSFALVALSPLAHARLDAVLEGSAFLYDWAKCLEEKKQSALVDFKRLRMLFLVLSVEWGYDTLLTAVDSVWLSNPFPELLATVPNPGNKYGGHPYESDLVFSNLAAAPTQTHKSVMEGFVFVRANMISIIFLFDVLNALKAEPQYTPQQVLNWFLFQRGTRKPGTPLPEGTPQQNLYGFTWELNPKPRRSSETNLSPGEEFMDARAQTASLGLDLDIELLPFLKEHTSSSGDGPQAKTQVHYRILNPLEFVTGGTYFFDHLHHICDSIHRIDPSKLEKARSSYQDSPVLNYDQEDFAFGLLARLYSLGNPLVAQCISSGDTSATPPIPFPSAIRVQNEIFMASPRVTRFRFQEHGLWFLSPSTEAVIAAATPKQSDDYFHDDAQDNTKDAANTEKERLQQLAAERAGIDFVDGEFVYDARTKQNQTKSSLDEDGDDSYDATQKYLIYYDLSCADMMYGAASSKAPLRDFPSNPSFGWDPPPMAYGYDIECLDYERNALQSALAIASVLDRALILPTFTRHVRNGTLDNIYRVLHSHSDHPASPSTSVDLLWNMVNTSYFSDSSSHSAANQGISASSTAEFDELPHVPHSHRLTVDMLFDVDAMMDAFPSILPHRHIVAIGAYGNKLLGARLNGDESSSNNQAMENFWSPLIHIRSGHALALDVPANPIMGGYDKDKHSHQEPERDYFFFPDDRDGASVEQIRKWFGPGTPAHDYSVLRFDDLFGTVNWRTDEKLHERIDTALRPQIWVRKMTRRAMKLVQRPFTCVDLGTPTSYDSFYDKNRVDFSTKISRRNTRNKANIAHDERQFEVRVTQLAKLVTRGKDFLFIADVNRLSPKRLETLLVKFGFISTIHSMFPSLETTPRFENSAILYILAEEICARADHFITFSPPSPSTDKAKLGDINDSNHKQDNEDGKNRYQGSSSQKHGSNDRKNDQNKKKKFDHIRHKHDLLANRVCERRVQLLTKRNAKQNSRDKTSSKGRKNQKQLLGHVFNYCEHPILEDEKPGATGWGHWLSSGRYAESMAPATRKRRKPAEGLDAKWKLVNREDVENPDDIVYM